MTVSCSCLISFFTSFEETQPIDGDEGVGLFLSLSLSQYSFVGFKVLEKTKRSRRQRLWKFSLVPTVTLSSTGPTVKNSNLEQFYFYSHFLLHISLLSIIFNNYKNTILREFSDNAFMIIRPRKYRNSICS